MRILLPIIVRLLMVRLSVRRYCQKLYGERMVLLRPIAQAYLLEQKTVCYEKVCVLQFGARDSACADRVTQRE